MLAAAFGALTQARAQTRVNPGQVARPPLPGRRAGEEVAIGVAPRVYEVRRADDLLILNCKLHNLRIIGSAPSQQITRENMQNPAWIVVEHQPQSIAEQAYRWPPGAAPPPESDKAKSYISGVSRLVFQMPSETGTANWGLHGLLDACRTWPMQIGDLARPAPVDLILLLPYVRALNVSQKRLDDAAHVILSSLPPDIRAEVGAVIPAASQRIAQKIRNAVANGGGYSDQELDALVGVELRAALGRTRTMQSSVHVFLSSRALEAAAASRSLAVLMEVAETAPKPPFALDMRNRSNNSLIEALNTPQPLGDDVTGIELPYRIVQSPLATAGWAHALAPVIRGDRTELWHTRLGARREDRVADLSPEPLRALWSPDYKSTDKCPPDVDPADAKAPGADPPERWALSGGDRRDIVRLTAGFNEKTRTGGAFTPIPTTAKRLILTALGGTLDLDGQWPTRPADVDIKAWTHRAALGRDYFVRIVKAGRLFPFGHAASLVRITERVFETHPMKGRMALLRQIEFIVVREPVRTYTGARQKHHGRDFPFRSIEVATKVTPSLDLRAKEGCDVVFSSQTPNEDRKCLANQGETDLGFVPNVGGKDFQFKLVGVDGAGRRIGFSASLVFVADSKNDEDDSIQSVIKFYDGLQGCADPAKTKRSTVYMNGAVIQFAPQSIGADLDGDTNLPTRTITFTAAPPTGKVPPGEPNYFPAVKEASVVLPAVKSLLGADRPLAAAFNGRYLDEGFAKGNAKSQIFLNIVGAVSGAVGPSANSPSDKFGGMISPNLTPKALSRNFGIVCGEDFQNNFGGGKFNPLDFLPDAKLLGAIDLKAVLREVADISAGSEQGKTPKFTTIESPDKIEARYSIEQSGLNSTPLFKALPGNRLRIDTRFVSRRNANAASAAPEAIIDGVVEHFQINLSGLLILTFDKLSFFAEPGKKPKVVVDLDPRFGVMFGGELEFINELKDVIPSAGFSDPAPISVTGAGVSAGYALSLPTLQVGICSISNISIGAAFTIPFTGEAPSARFNFAERHAPFNITVSMFGGGGFAAIVVDTGGMREIEIQLEFGAKVEINLGVASGGVYVKGGFYFHLKKGDGGDQKVEFEGFVELSGHLSVIGLITVSLVFHLALSFAQDKAAKTTRLFGQATLIVDVEILFFSKSVSIKVEKQFAGSKADPLFIDFIPTDAVWRRYCEAFA